jgi:hypothetical protein
MRPFDNLERGLTQNRSPSVVGCAAKARINPNIGALRRAVAKFNGLLTIGRNRKEPHRKSCCYRKDLLGDHWTLPEKQL